MDPNSSVKKRLQSIYKQAVGINHYGILQYPYSANLPGMRAEALGSLGWEELSAELLTDLV